MTLLEIVLSGWYLHCCLVYVRKCDPALSTDRAPICGVSPTVAVLWHMCLTPSTEKHKKRRNSLVLKTILKRLLCVNAVSHPVAVQKLALTFCVPPCVPLEPRSVLLVRLPSAGRKEAACILGECRGGSCRTGGQGELHSKQLPPGPGPEGRTRVRSFWVSWVLVLGCRRLEAGTSNCKAHTRPS